MHELSVVIPVYQAEACLDELYTRLRASIETFTKDFEIILVEDRSLDRSWATIQELARKDKRVKGLRFTRNFGQHYGITAGFDHADGKWVVVMDCDLQDAPEDVARLYAKACEGHPVVMAQRIHRKDEPVKRWLSALFYRIFAWLADMEYDGRVGNFGIFSKEFADQFRPIRERLRFFGGLVHWMGYPIVYITVEHGQGRGGRSSYTFGKLWRLAAETIIAYSDKPLRLSVKFGFFMALTSFACGVYVLYHAFFHSVPVMGWTSLIVSIYFLSGLIIMILGIIGLYLGKTFDETKRRPLYVVAERT